ncbi:MAG: TonB-system energizer ExbB [Succinivibrio sp.]|nr:TonB-system energizer ExbB [Succinivibrio sp.]
METLKQSVDIVIFIALGLMGFIALWLTLERLLFIRRFKAENYASEADMEKALTSNLTMLYIIYSNAPYVGLLGTVVGIMVTFYDIGTAGNLDPQVIMVGLSLALKATALGLVVAIPTLMAYHLLNRLIRVRLAAAEDKHHEN